MRSIRLLAVIVVLTISASVIFSQDSVITQVVKKDLTTFSIDKKTFTGNGWDILINQIQKSDFVLIGEDHFTNEIPFFFSAVTTKVKFDNFFCEIDPYSAKIMESKIQNLPEIQLRKYVNDFGNVFSFYALDTEFQLLEQLVKSKVNIYGLDQILLVADRLICNELKQKTKNDKAKKIYENIEEKSTIYFADFLKDQNKPFYMLTDEFEKEIVVLLQLNLSQEEKEKIEALSLTARIYKGQSHHLRIQLMKNNLMRVYSKWENKKNLFKFGANHLAKGESLLKIYDIGNLVNNVADSKYKNSLHVMIVGKSGTQSSPFNGFPEQPVDENGDNLKSLKPLFNCVTTEQWHCFDMLPIRVALESGKVTVKDIELSRIIMGYDYVIIIPKVTAAKFPKT
ncbi:MAG TPA: hypothetical protein VJA82_03835 [Sediminibacterium sp.]|uniref:hypothetical protein n=1 Tax=Sediminibacterium sp. TaxID=1917865 RepID=UPI0008D67894|nr:hypothetical protein [Sediminibacterium sp.]OHC84193.1 MAG: hypothetical protein A2472_14685 [Sphingobacteriia bacterium RIFOXYC2_FULL_35_18]OHC88000.1 MAG: hypothetical protein A2546_05490 [Sphingobacteriia bacterium RIFOXYD2_FULL_35_12]HLD52409.1 hypothetical protein [Sediminibacterium sp.]